MTRRIFKDNPRLASDLSKIDLKKWLEDYPEYIMSFCPYGQPGDKLWVREKFEHGCMGGYIYAADRTEKELQEYRHSGYKWKPYIHMPKSAARIWLEIISIKVERLQDINRHDALAEGISEHNFLEDTAHEETYYQYEFGGPQYPSAVKAFEGLWIKINGTDSWDANPWVWVIEFKRINTINPINPINP